MHIIYEGIKIFVSLKEKINDTKSSLVFIHGFANSSKDWQRIFSLLPNHYNLIAVDLPGFGKSDVHSDIKYYKSDFLLRMLNYIIHTLKLNKPVLIGYSMGGRLALSFAIAHPKSISALIIESASPGLKSSEEQIAKVEQDKAIIDFIRNNTIQDFVNFWKNLPFFESQKNLPQSIVDEVYSNLNELNPLGLINSLSGFGQGVMPEQWSQIENIAIPCLLISGEKDEKYCEINKLMRKKISSSCHEIVKDAGHNVHLEKPEEFVNLLTKFLQQIKFN